MASKEPLLPVVIADRDSSSSASLKKSDEIPLLKKTQRILSGKSLRHHLNVQSEGGDPRAFPHRKDVLKIEKEAVIQISKPALVQGLCQNFDSKTGEQFQLFARRVDSTVRAWYKKPFDELLHLYRFFEPLQGSDIASENKLTEEQINAMEIKFLKLLFFLMDKSNYKMVTNREFEVANEGSYKLTLPVEVDTSKVNSKLFENYFGQKNIPEKPSFAEAFAKEYLVFRRGVGMDLSTDRFVNEKIEMVLESIGRTFLVFFCIKKPKSWEPIVHDTRQEKDKASMAEDQVLSVERIHLEQMRLSLSFLFSFVTIQEPTFEKVVVLYRPATPPDYPFPLGDKSIHIKHFKHIPMADMEIVLPEKKTPGLTNKDKISFLATIAFGFIAISKAKSSPYVLLTIVVACVSYIVKLYMAWKNAMKNYSVLLQQSMYDKQLDSGHGTLLHLCDDVLEQEFKEVVVAYYLLLTTGKATREELDKRCELFMTRKFEEDVQFDVEDAVEKLLRMGLAKEDQSKKISCVPLSSALTTLGKTADELYGGHSNQDEDELEGLHLF